jgi:hypothetical protein
MRDTTQAAVPLSEWKPVLWENVVKLFRETREYGMTVPADADIEGVVVSDRHVTLTWRATCDGYDFHHSAVVSGDEAEILTGIGPLVLIKAGELARQCILSRIGFIAAEEQRKSEQRFHDEILARVRAYELNQDQGERLITASGSAFARTNL